MKILLDHNAPHQLRRVLPEHEVHTAAHLGWSELENGALLEAAASHGYDLLITCDQGISNEQNLNRYDVTLITTMSGDWTVIREKIDIMRGSLETARRGEANRVQMIAEA